MYLVQEIYPDSYLIENFLSLEELSSLENLYIANSSRLYVPKLKSGHYMNLEMTCFGKDWCAEDYKYYDCEEPVPECLINIAKRLSLKHFPYHNPDWNVCIMNRYTESSTLGLHVDNSESHESLKIGHPVVSFSIGYSATFRVGGFERSSISKDIELNHGDVFIFGGASRMRYHGIRNINTNHSLGCRVNFTLRKI